MCVIVNSDMLLAFLLRKKERVSFKALRSFRNKVESEFPELLIDISGPSLEQALFYYPQIFVRDQNFIARADNARDFLESEYINNVFFSSYQRPVVQKLKKVLAE